MNKMQVFRFTLEGRNGQMAAYDVISSKSPVEALATLVNVVPGSFLPFSVFSWYTVNVP